VNRIYTREKTDEVLSLLTDVGPMSTVELVLLTGRGPHSIRNSLRILRANKEIHISQYLSPVSKGRQQPVYSQGEGVDAVEKGKTAKERNAKYRAKHRIAIRARDAVRHKREVNMWAGLL